MPFHCLSNLTTYYITRKHVVTGRKVILFSFIFGSQFLSHQKISVLTKDTAELNVKPVKHNVITTKSIKMALGNLCTCTVQVRVVFLVTMVTMLPFAFYLICTWAVIQKQKSLISELSAKHKRLIMAKLPSRHQNLLPD